MPKFIEVSHVIAPGMRTYPGLPEPRQEILWDYETSRSHFHGQAEFFIANLHLCGNTGTYVDSPVHRFRDAADLSQLPLDSLAHLAVELIDVRGVQAVGPESLRGRKITGKAILFHTGWSTRWQTEAYFEPNPHLTADCCDALLDGGAIFAGIDSLNIDNTADPRRPAHTSLLGAGVPVCEHLTNLGAVRGGHLHAVPIAWKGGATFPVRAYVME
jgi:kynurenine formamidase